MSAGDRHHEKQKPKSVRFPTDGNETSARFDYERDDSETEAEDNEVDYFSLQGRSGSKRMQQQRQQQVDSDPFATPRSSQSPESDSSESAGGSGSNSASSSRSGSTDALVKGQEHNSSDSSDDEPTEDEGGGKFKNILRAATRANTLFNMKRQRANSAASNTQPIYAPPSLAATSDYNKEAMGSESYLNVGSNTLSMVPGSGDAGGDNDPLDREYGDRINQVLSTLTPPQGHRRSASMPASPLLRFTPADSDSIPLQDLTPIDKGYREESHTRESSGTDTLREDDSGSNLKPYSEEEYKEKQRHSGEKHSGEKRSGDGRRSKESTRSVEYDSKQEANDIANELVQAHLSKAAADIPKEAGDAGFVPTDQFLYAAAAVDDLDLDGIPGGENNESNNQQETVSVDDLEVGQTEIAPPERVREGVLGSLLRLYGSQGLHGKSQLSLGGSSMATGESSPYGTPGGTPGTSPLPSPSITPDYFGSSPVHAASEKLSKFGQSIKNHPPLLQRPSYFRSKSSEDVLGRKKEERQSRRKWYEHQKSEDSKPTGALGAMAKSSMLAVNAPGLSPTHEAEAKKKAKEKAKEKAKKAQNLLLKRKKAKEAEQKRITIHIADVLQRQRFILRLGRALMLYGAPSHRLEEYLRMTARVLEIDAQFLYMPGCMLVSFGDAATHTSETKIIRVAQGLNLNKLDATHLIYKEVVHDIMGLEEASDRIDALLKAKNYYSNWMVILFFGLASGFLALAFFGGRWPDLPLAFCFGTLVGFLQIQVAPRSDLYGNVFEVSSSILVSLLARAFGSISKDGSYVFCFAALTQGSLALILPGYIILIGSLELQSKNIVAGAVRMFYAIIYSMFLAFGIALGSAIYGWMDSNATNDSSCPVQMNHFWRILFVPLAAGGLAMVNQATWRQLPSMILIASAGYAVLYFIQIKINNASSFTSALGAFTIGILGNLYSRLGHGLAFASMLPGIFVIVPGGVAAQGSLISGITLANQITNSSSSSTSSTTSATDIGSLGGTMTQVAVGITVGLFVATLLVYPLGLGKKRSGLFTF